MVKMVNFVMYILPQPKKKKKHTQGPRLLNDFFLTVKNTMATDTV